MDEVPAFLVDHEAGVPQYSKMLRDGPLGHVEPGGQRADAEDASFEQLDDAKAALNGEDLQNAGKMSSVFHSLLVSANILN